LGLPGQDVDYPALAIDRERDLRLGQPSLQRGEGLRHRLMHGRVTRVDQPTEIATLPPDEHVDASVQRLGNATDGPQRDIGEAPVFNPTNDGRR